MHFQVKRGCQERGRVGMTDIVITNAGSGNRDMQAGTLARQRSPCTLMGRRHLEQSGAGTKPSRAVRTCPARPLLVSVIIPVVFMCLVVLESACDLL